MSMSGVTVEVEAVKVYTDQLKPVSGGKRTGPKLKYIIFGLASDLKRIVVLKTSDDPHLSYADFINEFPAKEPRWAAYDFEYETESDGKRQKICLFSWTPDDAPVRLKMVAATSNDAITKALPGIQAKVQATDYDQLVYEEVFKKVSKGA